MPQKALDELEKKQKRHDFLLVFQITSTGKIILNCVKTSLSHKDLLQH